MVQLACSVVLLSSAWPLTKLALATGATPLWFAEGRAVLSAFVAALLVGARGQFRMPRRADLPAIAAIGALQLAGYFAFAHIALAWIPAGRTAILANTTTIWIVPLSLLVLRERVPVRRWIAAMIGMAGVVVMMNPWAIDWSSAPVLIGHAFLLLSSLCWSIAIIVTRGTRPSMTMLELLPWCFTLASVLLFPLVAWETPHGTLGRDWWALAVIGLVAGPIGTWCVMEATAKLPTMVSSVGFLATPAVSLLLAGIVLGEPVTADLLLGTALILGGVAISALPVPRLWRRPAAAVGRH